MRRPTGLGVCRRGALEETRIGGFFCGWPLPCCSCKAFSGFTYKPTSPLQGLGGWVLDDLLQHKAGAGVLISLLPSSTDPAASDRESGSSALCAWLALGSPALSLLPPWGNGLFHPAECRLNLPVSPHPLGVASGT